MEMDVAAHRMAERKDLLILAQQRLDEINRGNLGLARGGRPGSASSRTRRSRKSAVSSHLLSTLLYVALMAHKLEDMKSMLATEDGDVYDEWRCLLETLHSPEFHARERVIQNQRVKTTFERKRRYKDEATKLRQELEATRRELAELQTLSNETSHEMSKTINGLQEERAALVAKDEERRSEMEELRQKTGELQRETESMREKLGPLQSDLEKKEQLIEERDRSIARLEKQLAECKTDAAVTDEKLAHAQSTFEDTRARLEASEAKHSEYRAETESLISKLQLDLSHATTSNAELNTKLAAANEALGVAHQNLEESRKTNDATAASFDELKRQSNDLREIVQAGTSTLDEKLAGTTAMLEKSRSDLKVVLSHSGEVRESLAALPALSNTTESLERSLKTVSEAVSALSSAALLEQFSDQIQQGLVDVRESLNDHSHSQSDDLRQELSNVRSKLTELLSDQRAAIKSEGTERGDPPVAGQTSRDETQRRPTSATSVDLVDQFMSEAVSRI
ncbi:hypothetical protein ACHAXT_007671 [Thalassiosira profunda]